MTDIAIVEHHHEVPQHTKGEIPMALELELATYRAHLPAILEHEGKWAVVYGDRIAGIWQTFEDALQAGYGEFGLTPFLVKQIHAVEPILYFTRSI